MKTLEDTKQDLKDAKDFIGKSIGEEDSDSNIQLYSYETESLHSLSTNLPWEINFNQSLVLSGSCDKIFTAIQNDAKKIVGIDKNPLIDHLYELKKAAILSMDDPEEWMNYFIFDQEQSTAFSRSYYEKYAKKLTPNSEYFWSSLYDTYSARTISLHLIKNCNFATQYLPAEAAEVMKQHVREEISFLNKQGMNTLREKLTNPEVSVKLKTGNFFDEVTEDDLKDTTYVNFSTLPYFIKRKEYRDTLVNKIVPQLPNESTIALAYLYHYTLYHHNSIIKYPDWETKQDLPEDLKLFKEEMLGENFLTLQKNMELSKLFNYPDIAFVIVPELGTDISPYTSDSVLIYHKTNKKSR